MHHLQPPHPMTPRAMVFDPLSKLEPLTNSGGSLPRASSPVADVQMVSP